MNLAYKFPIIFWDTACLIVDSGSMNIIDDNMETNEVDDFEENDTEEENDEEYDEEEISNNTKTKKKKVSTVNYGKIAAAIGKMKSRGLLFAPPNINKSDITFSPSVEESKIYSGLKGITRIGNDLIKVIMTNRPYSSMEDFLKKVKVNKTQMVALIKAGAFDELSLDRRKAMNEYLNLVVDKKKRITLQNMKMLMDKNMIPDFLVKEGKIYNFNKYLKQFAAENVYKLNKTAFDFFTQYFDPDLLINVNINGDDISGEIKQTVWDKLYNKSMDPIRKWMKENQTLILEELNQKLFNEIADKYAKGNISQWDMEALGTYYHEHELASIRKDVYGISTFESLNEEPEVASEIRTKEGNMICIYNITRICGTIIDKNKNKNMITILTPEMQVVHIKIWKNQYAEWDKQISRKNPDGTKTVVEKSFFARGNKIIITGIRRGDDFVPKKYKNTQYPLFEKIISMNDDGFITQSATERIKLEDE